MTRNDALTVTDTPAIGQPTRRTVVAPRPVATSIVPFDAWVEQRDRAAAALLSGTRRVLLTGPAGTGKTALLEHTARVLRSAGRTVVIQLADVDPAPPAAGTTLFVDEADRLPPKKLHELYQAPGSLVLAGLGTLARRVPASATHLTLEPLGQEAARLYIAAWLAQTGRVPADLDSMAVRRLFELSGGVPRLLSTLLAAASWMAETGGAPVIDASHVEEAAELRSVMPEAASTIRDLPPHRRAVGWALVAAPIGIIAVAALPYLFPAQSSRFADRVIATAERPLDWIMSERTPPAPVPIPQQTSPFASQALPVETVQYLVQRGREMLQSRDVPAARLLFRRAADSGSGQAMLELGHSYDAAVLAQLGAGHLANQEQANQWYESAAAAGNTPAGTR